MSAYRELGCGEPRADMTGRALTLAGWVGRRRDHGGLIFIDLRDRSGVVQLVIDPEHAPAAHAAAHDLRLESVIQATGTLIERSEATRNPALATGDVELQVDALEVLSAADPLPFQLDDEVDETLRLHHRYLDLRRPAMRHNLETRARLTRSIRRILEERGFWELETPCLIRSTPEGARDFIVPARSAPGSFYGLPQSPQLYKQLYQVAGYERYYQIARCFRDEAQRADRQLEFTQIDVEMSFVDREDVLELLEHLYCGVWQEVLGHEVPRPLPRLTYADAMLRYGVDRPDLRFGCEIADVTEVVRASGFGVFSRAAESGGVVRGLAIPGAATLTRKELDALVEFAKEWGGQGIAYLLLEESGEVRSPIAKFLTEDEIAAIREATGAKDGDGVFLAADTDDVVCRVLGALRPHLAGRFDLIPSEGFAFCFVVDFPLFERDEEAGRWVARHHPFTSPSPEHVELLESDPVAVLADAYDLVCNGHELAGGSIRIHSPELQARVLEAVGFTREDAEARFGFLLRALRTGAPPHGGFAGGIDRAAALLAGVDGIREVIAFPKAGGGSDPLTGAPAPVDAHQLTELGLALAPPPKPAGT